MFRSKSKFEKALEDATDEVMREGRAVLRNIGWVSAGITMLAVGVVIGRELRQRYKFTRRTPYDVYAHSGDEAQEIEFV
ncbi:MAG: hypothetical protein ABI142_11820 [Bryocella sp.]